MVTLRVFRWSDESPEHFDEFPVAAGPETTVLDALVETQRTRDATLAFRYACRVGMCGSCGMVVNGRERWACRTRLAALDTGTVTVRPLYHFPVIRDLVVDMAPFRARMTAVGGEFVPHTHTPSERGGPTTQEPHTPSERGGPTTQDPHTPSAVVSRDSRERREIDEAIECIGCGMCVSACTLAADDARFPGPAALNRAFTLQRDHRDGVKEARWSVLLGTDALSRCHGQGNCTEVCPMELSPVTSILRLRRMATRRLFGFS